MTSTRRTGGEMATMSTIGWPRNGNSRITIGSRTGQHERDFDHETRHHRRHRLDDAAAAGVKHYVAPSVTIMPTQLVSVQMTPLAVRVQGEFQELPGLRLTVRQDARWL